MKKIRVITILVIITFVFTEIAANFGWLLREEKNDNIRQLTKQEKLEDFDYMYKILQENYPFFEVNKRLNGTDWLGRKEEYINRIRATYNDESFFNTMSQILSELHNGHVHMVSKNNYLDFKATYEKYSDGRKAWVEEINKPETTERYSSMIGTETPKAIAKDGSSNNVKAMDLEKGKIGYISIKSFLDGNLDEDMKIILPYLEGIKDYKALIIDIRGNGGGTNTYWADIVERLIDEPVEERYYMAFRGGEFEEKFFKEIYGAGFEKLTPISALDKENFQDPPPELKEDFKYYDKFIDRFEPKNPIGFKGKIYLLVDQHVFSASEQFASFAKSTGFATLVGEKTGGDGIGFEPAICSLPNSGYLFRFSQEMGLTSSGSCNFENKTEPDIVVQPEKKSNISEDKAIQAVLKLLN